MSHLGTVLQRTGSHCHGTASMTAQYFLWVGLDVERGVALGRRCNRRIPNPSVVSIGGSERWKGENAETLEIMTSKEVNKQSKA